ncbi:MAG TPA: hypothetical protein VLL25_10535, partial [Acidimicrobiales bacterium]|nr:hypothetical protein [Acidimicrobiales bacterium]
TVALPAIGASAHADDSPIPTIHPKLFATAPPGATKPDDITKLDNLLYVSYQNNAGKDGSPPGSTSTIVALDRADGSVAKTYILTGRCDGLTADPAHDRLFASVNEDNNSSLYVITPGSATPVVHYSYSPDPAEIGTDMALNGGTDAISISTNGTVYVAHSNPAVGLNTAAVYTLTLSGTTAKLTPFFGVNDVATVVNPTPGSPTSAPLGLTDPDSNRFLPGKHGGTLIQDAQADSKLVFVTHLRSAQPKLRLLNLTNATVPTGGAATPQLDDIERVTGEGVLYAVDQKGGNIYAINISGVESGTLFVSQPNPAAGDLPNDPAIGVVDPKTGVVTHVDSTLGSPKGLLFVAGHDSAGHNGAGHNGAGQDGEGQGRD